MSLIGHAPFHYNLFGDNLNLDKIIPGANPPEDINIIITCEKESGEFYKYDKTADTFVALGKVKAEFNYGFVPKTHQETEEIDAVLFSEESFELGSVVSARPIGAVRSAGKMPDSVIIAVPRGENAEVKDIKDLPDNTLKSIMKFLESMKEEKYNDVLSVDKAKKSVQIAVERYERLK